MRKQECAALETAGIASVNDATFASVETISAAGFSLAKSRRIVENACSSLTSTYRGSILTSQKETRRKISTGSKLLDSAMSGGIPTGRVTDIYGASGVGKTQLCLQLCINVQKLRSARDEPLAALYVDTSGTFRPERLVEMAENAGMKGEEVLQLVYGYSARSVTQQSALPSLIQENSKRHPLGLVVIDTLTENFIYQPSRELTLLQRQLLLAKHLNDLSHLAMDSNLAIVVTNSVRTLVEEGGAEVQVGGSSTNYGPHLQIWLQKKHKERTATVMHPPFKQVYFAVEIQGIMDSN
ncbi:MAG: AAA family ATPase [Thaumarchaeota archaeon]|nr:AAA family ATPase [Nitrososphaerota archaeon]